MKLISVTDSNQIEWFREGDLWPREESADITSKLVEAGALRPGNSGLRLRFVGAIAFEDRTLVSLPKIKTAMAPSDVHRVALRAMRRYRQWVPTHHAPAPYLNESPEKGPVSSLAATDWLVRDFATHGLIRRTEAAFEQNCRGITDWKRTVEGVDPVISRGRPVYLDTINRRALADNRNFATRLHCYLLERLSAAFGPVLDIEPIILDHEPVERLEALPSVEECEARLVFEQRTTYSQRGLELLNIMLAAVRAIEIETTNGLTLFGTSSFHHVWEAACASGFGNDVDSWMSCIPRPVWTSRDGARQEGDSFIPDLVTPMDDGVLLIGDAKYYRPLMPPRLANVPGVNDVAKQIWYKQSLADQAQVRGYHAIQNVFLFPADSDHITWIGRVELPLGGEWVDAVCVPFAEALAIYSGEKSHVPSVWRQDLSRTLSRSSEHARTQS